MDVDFVFKFIEKFRRRVQWYRMQTEDFPSKISSISNYEDGNLVSFKGQSITSTFLIKEVFSFK